VDYLATPAGLPIEREFEGWIVGQIDDYFSGLGVPVTLFAVSPKDESTWPADEALDLEGKLVGLQFKRPHLRGGQPNDFSRLYWELAQPATQLPLVYSHKEIYYCLPTFANRTLRREALHHCLFWRPEGSVGSTAWYCNHNPQVKTPFIEVCDAPRWGWLVEQVLKCDVGYRMNGRSFRDYMSQLVAEVEPERRAAPIQMMLFGHELLAI